MNKSEKIQKAFEYLKYNLIIQTKKEMADRMGIGDANLNKQFKNPSDKFLLRFNKAFGNIFNEQWLLRDAEGPMLASDVVDRKLLRLPEKPKTKPRIPTLAMAGELASEAPSDMLSYCEQMPVIANWQYDFTIVIGGDSMIPVFVSGDELACRFVDKSSIRWGRPHVLATREGAVVKRIYDDGEYLRCVSYNANEYPEYRVEKENVFQIALVVGVLRSLD